MDRDWLAAELGGGRSIGDVARELGKHPATVAYWANKHRLASRHAAKHAPRGGIDASELWDMVERGLSVRQIAATRAVGATTVRHWLRRHGLKTRPARYSLRNEPRPEAMLRDCRTHGWTAYIRSGSDGAYRCPRCASARVSRRRRRVKETLVAEFGGHCAICGYNRYAGALQFHHLDPARKRIEFARAGLTHGLETLREEARKCVLLCANCHAEVEAGLVPADGFRGSAVRGSSTAEQTAVNR
jgi:transposase